MSPSSSSFYALTSSLVLILLRRKFTPLLTVPLCLLFPLSCRSLPHASSHPSSTVAPIMLSFYLRAFLAPVCTAFRFDRAGDTGFLRCRSSCPRRRRLRARLLPRCEIVIFIILYLRLTACSCCLPVRVFMAVCNTPLPGCSACCRVIGTFILVAVLRLSVTILPSILRYLIYSPFVRCVARVLVRSVHIPFVSRRYTIPSICFQRCPPTVLLHSPRLLQRHAHPCKLACSRRSLSLLLLIAIRCQSLVGPVDSYPIAASYHSDF